MNSRVGKNAPWLIFDDPVVHVDDLNTLSFFDTLRELVLEEKRQIFFSTANTRVANLFARKFDFFGVQEFKEIRLGRAAS
jgi:DNA repair protein SbcC/Rad50